MKNKKILLLLAFFGLSLLPSSSFGDIIETQRLQRMAFSEKSVVSPGDTFTLMKINAPRVYKTVPKTFDSCFVYHLDFEFEDSVGIDSVFIYEGSNLIGKAKANWNASQNGNIGRPYINFRIGINRWMLISNQNTNATIYTVVCKASKKIGAKIILVNNRYNSNGVFIKNSNCSDCGYATEIIDVYKWKLYTVVGKVNPKVSVGLRYVKHNNSKFFCIGDLVNIYDTLEGKKYIIQEKYTLNGKTIDKSCLLPLKLSDTLVKINVYVKDSFSRIFKDSLVFNAKPNPSGKITSLNGFVYCKGDSLELRYSNSAIDSIRWMFPDSMARVRDLGTATIGPGLYKVRVDSSGCTSLDSVFITENPLPQLNIVGKSGFCKGDSVVLVCNKKKDETVSWSNGSELSSKDSFVTKSSGLCRVKITDSNKCFRDSVITIIDYKTPLAEIVVSKEFFCEGDTNHVSLNDQVVHDWYWIINNKKVETKSVAVYSKTSIKLYTTSIDGCNNSSFIELSPKSLPPAEIIVSKEFFCEGDNNYVSLKNNEVASWYWIVNKKKIEDKTVTITTSTFVELHTTSVDGCKNSSIVELVAKSLPEKPIIMSNDSMLWSLNNSKTDSLVWCEMGKPIIGANGRFFKPLYSGYYTLKVYSQYGCENESALLTYSVKVKTNSIADMSGTQFKIYPNPATDQITIESNLERGEAQLVDMQGRVVRTIMVEHGSNTVYRDGLAAGVYALHLNGNSARIVFQ